MPEQKMSYEKRLYKAAETIAKSSFSKWSKMTVKQRKNVLVKCYDAAVAMVAAQSEAIREILLLFFSPKYLDVDKLLLEHGYIEPETDTLNLKTMPEQKMTYKERLKSTAKRHADRYNAGGRREYAGGPLLRNEPEHMMDEAEETIAMQVEAIREFALNECGFHISKSAIDLYLLEHGYIEPKTEEDGNYKRDI